MPCCAETSKPTVVNPGGSSGQGKELWQLIDYGGLENDDVFDICETP